MSERTSAKGADEGAAHPLRIAKAGGWRDAFELLQHTKGAVLPAAPSCRETGIARGKARSKLAHSLQIDGCKSA